nr:hypothetical protein [Acidobacteriota bacterium]
PYGYDGPRRAAARPLPPRDDGAADTSAGGVIRVTIGRIEVHAVTPPPPTPKPYAPPAPKLSLEEYLRQHNGGRR